MNPSDLNKCLATAREYPTAYQVAVALADIAERIRITIPDATHSLLAEAITQVRTIKQKDSRAYALRTMFNYAKPIGANATRPILNELASLQCDHPEPVISESLIGVLVSARADTNFVDNLADGMQPEARRDMAVHAIATARQHDRAKLAPKQPKSMQTAYRCKTINDTCRIIYQAAKGRGRRWQHDWTMQWCKSASQCGVHTAGKLDWTRCEHPDSHLDPVPGPNHHPANQRHN